MVAKECLNEILEVMAKRELFWCRDCKDWVRVDINYDEKKGIGEQCSKCRGKRLLLEP